MTVSRSARSPAMLLVTSAACAGLVVACSLTTSFAGLSNGADVPDSTASDGGNGGGSAEAGPGLDDSGGTDGSALDGTALVPFCDSLTPKPTFCDDFERTSLLGSWDNRALSGGGSVTLESSTRTATGHELLAAIPV